MQSVVSFSQARLESHCISSVEKSMKKSRSKLIRFEHEGNGGAKLRFWTFVAVVLSTATIFATASADNLLKGYIRLETPKSNTTTQQVSDPSNHRNDNALNLTDKAAKPSFPNSPDALINKYGIAANSPAVADAITQNQLTEKQAKAKLAADRFEALSKGYLVPNATPLEIIVHGNVPPGMSAQQALTLYSSLPHLLRFTQALNQNDIARMANEPSIPISPLPMNFAQTSQIYSCASQQYSVESYLREVHGPATPSLM